MKYRVLFPVLALMAATSLRAYADPKDDLAAAVAKTADSPNYSWTTTVEGGQNNAAPTTGKFEKDGYTTVTLPARDSSFDVVIKDKKAVVKTDDGWKTADELAAEQGATRMVARNAATFQAPLTQASDQLKKVGTVKAEADGFSGDLTEDAAKAMLTFRGRRNADANAPAPTIKNPKAEFRVWTKDGLVSKVQYHISGTVTFNDQDRDIDRTTTIELKDIGTTKVDVPEDAKKKLEEPAATTKA